MPLPPSFSLLSQSAGISRRNTFRGTMEHSTGLNNLEAMIEESWSGIDISDFDRLLTQLEEDEHVTVSEHRSLLRRLTRKYTGSGEDKLQ